MRGTRAGVVTAVAIAVAPLAGALAGAAPAGASELLPAPGSHGGDPTFLDRLPEVPGPTGGRWGNPPPPGGVRTAEQVAFSLPEVWCGVPSASDNLAAETANGDFKYHAIYAYPSDGLSQLPAHATRLHVDALQASGLLERLYGRAVRLDMGTTCGPQFVDISEVRLRSSSADLVNASAAGTVFGVVAADLRAAGFALLTGGENSAEAATRRKNFLVWLDGPAPAGVCGQASVYDDPSRTQGNWNNYGGKMALVHRTDSGFCGSNTARHEIGHNLGALQPGAPSAFDGAHCNDAYEDTMCYPNAPARGTGDFQSLYFDYGNNDYWDPAGGSLGRWAVNLSRFLCPDVGCNVPGGSSGGGLLDRDGDQIPDSLDPCPDTAGTDCPVGGDPSRQVAGGARARVSTRKLGGRGKKQRWRMTVRVTGRGRVRVELLCGKRAVYTRATGVPRTLKRRVRCAKRPRARVTALKQDQRG